MMRGPLFLAVLLAAVVAVSASTFRVSEVEQVIVTQFGEPVGDPITEPGLKFKLPFVQVVHRFDKRWLEWDGQPAEMPTKEKTYIWADTYARWRIIDPLKFFTSVRDERGAQSRLDDIIESETRNVIAAHELKEIVRSTNRAFKVADVDAVGAEGEKRENGKIAENPTPSTPAISSAADAQIRVGRTKLAQMVLEAAARAVPDYGIELVDVQFQRVNYTESVRRKVFDRMVSERKRIAEEYRSEGQGERARILGERERRLKEIQSAAYRQVQEIKGRADAKATSIYADAHNLDPDLYRLLKSLENYRESIGPDTTLILSTDGAYLEPLVKPKGF